MTGLTALAGCAAPGLHKTDLGRLAQRTYVVTGASSGIGRGIAERLGAAHANVVLAARRADVLGEVAARVEAAGGQALVVPTDVSDAGAVEALGRAAVQRFGRVDVWINDAGVGAIGRFADIPLADHARVVDVNLKGVIYGSHVALNLFRQQGQGTLVNLGSVEGKVPTAYHASYSATKHAIVALGAALYQELRLDGSRDIHVATVLPWAVDTPYFTHSANYSGHTARMILFDDAQRVADAVVWLSLHPRKQLAVGWKAKSAVTGYQLAPGLAEHFAAGVMHRVQMEAPPPAPPTSGNLHQPMAAGTTIDGGIAERIRREEAEKRAGRPR